MREPQKRIPARGRDRRNILLMATLRDFTLILLSFGMGQNPDTKVRPKAYFCLTGGAEVPLVVLTVERTAFFEGQINFVDQVVQQDGFFQDTPHVAFGNR